MHTLHVQDDYFFYVPYVVYDKLLFMNRLFWNDIHHLLGFPVPSA